MANVRYMGSAAFDMVVTKDDGKFDKTNRVRPGDEVQVSDDAAERFLQGPRHLRVWVEVGGKEDPESNSYERSRYEAVSGNATPYPELDMGSTTQPRRAMFRTEDDNPEGFDVAASDEGTPSDNAALYEEDEARAAADKAHKETLAKSASKTATKPATPQGGSQGSAPANTADKA
jgi:hypothetical protein